MKSDNNRAQVVFEWNTDEQCMEWKGLGGGILPCWIPVASCGLMVALEH